MTNLPSLLLQNLPHTTPWEACRPAPGYGFAAGVERRLCGAARYERSESRQDTRAGSYDRSLHTKAGEVKLKVPKLRRQTFETAIIERYRRRESSVEEALIEMYLAGVSGKRCSQATALRLAASG